MTVLLLIIVGLGVFAPPAQASIDPWTLDRQETQAYMNVPRAHKSQGMILRHSQMKARTRARMAQWCRLQTKYTGEWPVLIMYKACWSDARDTERRTAPAWGVQNGSCGWSNPEPGASGPLTLRHGGCTGWMKFVDYRFSRFPEGRDILCYGRVSVWITGRDTLASRVGATTCQYMDALLAGKPWPPWKPVATSTGN